MIKNIGNFKDFKDDTIKSVYNIGDNKIIEISVLFNKKDKDVVCVPTHHFCNLGCKMCHLTNKGLNKAMIPINYKDFIYCLIETLKKYKTNKKKLLISFMGVGEPLLNLELIYNVFKNQEILINLGYSDISYAISTMMPNNNLIKLINMSNSYNIPIKVHFSLHTAIEEDRRKLIPGTKVSIVDAMLLLKQYESVIMNNKIIMKNYNKFHKTCNPIEIHYTLIKNVNDSNKELNALIELLKQYKCAIKFIRLNPTNCFERSNKEEKWINSLKKNISDLRVKVYSPPGSEIGSSCGEFTKHYYHSEIETKSQLNDFNEWYNKHVIQSN